MERHDVPAARRLGHHGRGQRREGSQPACRPAPSAWPARRRQPPTRRQRPVFGRPAGRRRRRASASPAPQPAATPAPAPGHPGAGQEQRRRPLPRSRPPGRLRGAAAPAGPGTRRRAPARSPRADPADSSNGAQRSAPASPGAAGTPARAESRATSGPHDDRHPGSRRGGAARVGLDLRRGAARSPSGHRSWRHAAAIVDQRALRRARLRSADDPILAAMGLPDEDATAGAAPPRPGRHPGTAAAAERRSARRASPRPRPAPRR